MKNIQASAALIGLVALIAIVALMLEWATGSWLPGWVTISLFIVSPLVIEAVWSVLGWPSQVIGFLIFPSVGFGVPALILYLVLKGAGWPWSA